MYYVICHNPTLLHQTNNDYNKVYEINRLIITVIKDWILFLRVKRTIFPMFSQENKLSIQIW